MAKKTKGISISARLNRRRIGILLITAVKISRLKKAIKAGQRVMGVATETEIKAKTVRIFTCEGSEWVTEWRCK
jgi:hypothetical protein